MPTSLGGAPPTVYNPYGVLEILRGKGVANAKVEAAISTLTSKPQHIGELVYEVGFDVAE